MYIILAWRNIWRNPRRTIVILSAVIIGVWSMIFLGALMRGMESEMVRNSISTLTGSIQIHHKNYLDDPIIEHSMNDIAKLEKAISESFGEGDARAGQKPDVRSGEKVRWAKRIRVNGIASNARQSGGVTIVGIEPEKEKEVSFIGKAVVSGRYLKSDDKSKIVVGRAFLENFNTKIGNKIILMSQNMQNEIASKAFRIVGSFTAESESFEKQFVFIPISQAARMLGVKNAVSEVSILLPKLDITGKRENDAAKKIKAVLLDDNYAVETWQDLLPMIKAYLEMSGFFLYIWYFVVFIAMGFGIVNTTLMAIFERMREFGLMKALGMRPIQIVKEVVTESFFLLVMGISAGILFGFLSVALISKNGIDLSALSAGAQMWGIPRVLYPEIWMQDVLVAGFVVLLLGILVSLYPAFKAARFTPTEAMSRN